MIQRKPNGTTTSGKAFGLALKRQQSPVSPSPVAMVLLPPLPMVWWPQAPLARPTGLTESAELRLWNPALLELPARGVVLAPEVVQPREGVQSLATRWDRPPLRSSMLTATMA